MCSPHRTAAGRLVAVLFASAGLAGTLDAHAADGVQLYGLIGSYVGSMKRSDNIDRATVVGSGGLTTSWWGVRRTDVYATYLKDHFALKQKGNSDTVGNRHMY
jgi:hypothetical protein